MLDPSILVGTTHAPVIGGLNAAPDEQLQSAVAHARLAESRARILATVLELQTSLDQARDLNAAATQAARMLAKVLPAARVQIAWKDKPEATCRIVADSESSAPDESSLANAAAEEVSSRAAIAILPCQDDANRHSLLALQQYAKSMAAEAIVASPIAGDQGEPLGAVIAINPGRSESALGDANAFLHAACPSLAQKFKLLQQMQPRRWEQIVRSLTDPAFEKRRRLATVALAVCAAIMLVPVHYNVPAACELQPVERRFIDAPFDGPLENVLVRPGDVVEKDEPLARINPREIEYELAGLRADLKRAEQEKKGLVAEHDFAGSRIADLEAKRIRLEADLLEYQRGNLEIRSPLTGVVVTGDLKKLEGTPLTKGEPLFEIAPLGEMIVEVAIFEADLAYVDPGMEVSFYLHAMPGQILSGQLARIHPTAELRDHENVFVGEVRLRDQQGVLRPGMRGRAWVRSGRRPLGWNLFHKAYFATRHAVGW